MIKDTFPMIIGEEKVRSESVHSSPELKTANT